MVKYNFRRLSVSWWSCNYMDWRLWFGMNGWVGMTVWVNRWLWKSALIQQSSSHSKWMCEKIDPSTGLMFPQTTVEEMGHMSPEEIGNSSPTEAPLTGQLQKTWHLSQESVIPRTWTHNIRSQWNLFFTVTHSGTISEVIHLLSLSILTSTTSRTSKMFTMCVSVTQRRRMMV